MKKFITIVIALFTFAVHADVASLSLSSTNDYQFVAIPTNGTIDVRGIGCGEDGGYRMPRREDWLFISEALAERRWVASSLWRESALPIVRTNLYAPLYGGMPWVYSGWGRLYGEWLDGIYGGTNFVGNFERLVVADNLNTQAFASSNAIDKTTLDIPRDAVLGIFRGGAPHIERQLSALAHLSIGEWVIPRTSAMLLGFVTNAYHDISTNQSPIYRRVGRTGKAVSRDPGSTHFVAHERPYGYNFSRGTWNCDDGKYTLPVSGSEWDAYSAGPCYDEITVTAGKTAMIAYDSSGQKLAEKSGSAYTIDERSGEATVHVRFALPTNRITSIRSAFAVCDYLHERVYNQGSPSETNLTFRRTVMIPITLGHVERDGDYEVYDTEHAPLWYRNQCRAVLHDSIHDGDDLIDTISDPDYPTPPTDPQGEGTRANDGYSVDRIRVDVRYIIGVLDYDFRAKVL